MRLRREFHRLIRPPARGIVVAAVAAVLLGAPVLLGGCLATAAYDVVTLPVRVVGSGIDAVTTSRSEADRNRGRRERKAEEKQRKADDKQAKADDKRRRAEAKAARQATS